MQVKYDEPISILCDNTNAIDISKNPVMHSKMKHILIKYHFLQEHATKKNIKLEYGGTIMAQVVGLTKHIPTTNWQQLESTYPLSP
jgi:hypothetical protein